MVYGNQRTSRVQQLLMLVAEIGVSHMEFHTSPHWRTCCIEEPVHCSEWVLVSHEPRFRGSVRLRIACHLDVEAIDLLPPSGTLMQALQEQEHMIRRCDT